MSRQMRFGFLIILAVIVTGMSAYFVFIDNDESNEALQIYLNESLDEISEEHGVEYGITNNSTEAYDQLTDSDIETFLYEAEVRSAMMARLVSDYDEKLQSEFNPGNLNPVLSDGIGGTATVSERYMLQDLYESFSDLLSESSHIDKNFSFSYQADQESENELLHFISIPDFSPTVTGHT